MAFLLASGAHRPPDQEAIRVSTGDTVAVGECDKVWPEFVFVLTDGGVGWVPARHLSAHRPDAQVLIPYDTCELAVTRGDVLSLVDDDPLSGWAWCRAQDGREGWVPHNILTPVEEVAR